MLSGGGALSRTVAHCEASDTPDTLLIGKGARPRRKAVPVQTTENGRTAEESSHPAIKYVVDSSGRRADHASASRFADVLIRLSESRDGEGEGEEEPPPREPIVRRGTGGFVPCFKCGERRESRRGLRLC